MDNNNNNNNNNNNCNSGGGSSEGYTLVSHNSHKVKKGGLRFEQNADSPFVRNLTNGMDEADKLERIRHQPRFVVTRDGRIALFNIYRYPIILYADQWEKIESLMCRDIYSRFVARNNNIINRKTKLETSETVSKYGKNIDGEDGIELDEI